MKGTRRAWRGWGGAVLALVAATTSCGKTNTGAPSEGDGGAADQDIDSAAGGKSGRPGAGSTGGKSAGPGMGPVTAGRGGAQMVPAGGKSGGVGGASGGKGGAGGASGGKGGTGSIPVTCEGRTCAAGQVCIGGLCGCPPFAPTYCEAAQKCVNLARDPERCGDCAIACESQAACQAGSCGAEPVRLAEFPGCGSLALLRVGAALYVLSRDAGSLSRVALVGSPAPVEIASGLSDASAFAIGGDVAYVASGINITRVTLSTGVKSVVTTAPARVYDLALAAGGDTLYYGTEQRLMSVSASANNGPGTPIAQAIDEGRPQAFAISSGRLLFSSADSYNVASMPLAGGEQLKLGASQGSLYFGHRALQADANNVFWPNGGIQRASVLTTIPAQAAVSRGTATAFAIDGTPNSSTTVVYVASDSGDLEVSELDAEQASWLARGLGNVTSLAIDDESVYIAADCWALALRR